MMIPWHRPSALATTFPVGSASTASWYVLPDVRTLGVGRQLVEAVARWARAQGYSELASDALIANTASQAAHTALGFEEASRIVCFRKDLRQV